MCGRFTLTASREKVAETFGVPVPQALKVRYNVAPSQVVAVVGLRPDGRRALAALRWGLVPHWSNTPNPAVRPINLRGETVLFKFGGLLRERRCLIPADGFYEWSGEGKSKVPHRFTLASGEPFAFAGLWDLWGEGKDGVLTCCLITTAANDLVRPFHDRMPVIVPTESYAEWLDPSTPVARINALLKPYPADGMQAAKASRAVNSPKNDGPECLEAA